MKKAQEAKAEVCRHRNARLSKVVDATDPEINHAHQAQGSARGHDAHTTQLESFAWKGRRRAGRGSNRARRRAARGKTIRRPRRRGRPGPSRARERRREAAGRRPTAAGSSGAPIDRDLDRQSIPDRSPINLRSGVGGERVESRVSKLVACAPALDSSNLQPFRARSRGDVLRVSTTRGQKRSLGGRARSPEVPGATYLRRRVSEGVGTPEKRGRPGAVPWGQRGRQGGGARPRKRSHASRVARPPPGATSACVTGGRSSPSPLSPPSS